MKNLKTPQEAQAQTDNEPIQLLTVDDAARVLAISKRLLWSLTSDRSIPSVKIGRSVRYDMHDLKAFIHRNKRHRR